VRWIAQEAPGVVPGIGEDVGRDVGASDRFILSRDGRPLAATAPHGGRIDWLAASGR
jgi:hypothetical protein